MNILWIADFGIQHNYGGAQQTNQSLIDAGRALGENIDCFYYDSPSEMLINKDYDLVVSANLANLWRRPDILNFITTHKNHIRIEHDDNRYMSQPAREALFKSCKATFFMSSYHIDMFIQRYGNIYQNVGVVFPFIDGDIFYDQGLERTQATLYAGFLHPLKGTHKFFDEVLSNPDKKYVMAGWGSKELEGVAKKFDNLEWLGKIDYKDMPNLLNSYTNMYFHPVGFEPFCRSIAEAILCGMEVSVSDNIGAYYEYKELGHDMFKQKCENSSSAFWAIVRTPVQHAS